MPLPSRLSSLWRNLFRKARKEQELSEEIDAYLGMLIEIKIKEGLNPGEARRAALLDLGGKEQVKERVREVSSGYRVESWWRDLRYALRIFGRHPGFTTVVVLTWALGIGATTTIFSVVNGVVLRPLPYREPEGLVRLWQNKTQAGISGLPLSAGNINIWRKQAQSFETVAAYSTTASVITGEAEPEQIIGAAVSANLLPMLGYQPLLGRHFLAEDNKPGGERIIILSHKLWQRRFGGDRSIVGRSITLDYTNSYAVVGIMSPGESYPALTEFWIPERQTATDRHDTRFLTALARLKPGVTPHMARAEVTLINQQLIKQLPDDYAGWEVELQPLHQTIVGGVRTSLLTLFGAVGFVLLIACANVTNLLLARASTRLKEMALRAALGAGRFRLIRQLLTESALLAVAGGAAGLVLARLAISGLIALDPPDVPRLAQVDLDGRVLAFTLVTTLLVSIIFGLAPALNSSKPDLINALKEGAASAGRSKRRLFSALPSFGVRDGIIIAQTALAVVLLIGAGLLIKSFVKLRQVELGFTPANVISLTLAPPFSRYPKDFNRMDYYRQLLETVKTMSGVEAVALTTSIPTTGAWMNVPTFVAGQAKPTNTDGQRAFASVVSADYFRTAGITLKQGRVFTEDDREGSPLVTIINEKMARTYFANTNPIGQRIYLQDSPDKQMEVIGVAADVKQLGVGEENKPFFYQPYRQRSARGLTLLVRTQVEPSSFIPALRGYISSVDKYTAITQVRTLDEVVFNSIAQPRFYMLLLTIFAWIALLLAAVGIYGLMAYTVNQRKHEIGIRLALGAQTNHILRMIVGQGLSLILIGILIGLIASLMVTQAMSKMLFEVSATDPHIFIIITFTLIVVALSACVLPARRATRIDPLIGLRHE
jgi:predicted permease